MDNLTDQLHLNNTPVLVKQVIHIWTWASIDTVLMIMIVGGNILTLCALNLSRKLSSVISNHFISSLACSDLLVGLMLPYHLAFYITDILGKNKFTCLLRYVMIVFACCASLYNLLAIAIDRYIAIIHPLHYSRYMTRRVAYCIIASGWITAVTIATIPIYWNVWNIKNEDCDLYKILDKNYVAYVLTPSFCSIWLAMLILYWKIWKEARGHAKRLKNSSQYSSHGCPPINDRKSVQVVFIIMGCFSICWLPYFIMVIFLRIQSSAPASFYEAAFTLAMMNSGMNPLIYAWKNKGIRKAFIRLLQCQTPNFNDSQNFINNRKDLKISPVSFDGLCIVNENCVEMQEKCNEKEIKKEDSTLNQDKDGVTNGVSKIINEN